MVLFSSHILLIRVLAPISIVCVVTTFLLLLLSLFNTLFVLEKGDRIIDGNNITISKRDYINDRPPRRWPGLPRRPSTPVHHHYRDFRPR